MDLKSADIIFFIALVIIVLLCIGFYFLIPVLNKKNYKQARQDLETRRTAYYNAKGIDVNQLDDRD